MATDFRIMWSNMVSVPLNALGADELKRRIEAARILRNVSQPQLDALFVKDGLRKSAGRMERGELPLTRARLDGLVRHLRVPEAWFTEEDVDRLVYPADAPLGLGVGALSRIEEQIQLLRAETTARVAEVLKRIDERLEPSRETQSRRPA